LTKLQDTILHKEHNWKPHSLSKYKKIYWWLYTT